MGKSFRKRQRITMGLLVLAVPVVFLAVIYVPVWIKPSLSGAELNAVHSGQIRITLQQAQAQLQNSIRATLLQALGGILVIAGAVATWRQVQISREGQITDRLTHAIDQLGADKADIRIGGIFALERLARDSAADRLAIAEILAAFIRAHAAWPAGHRSHPDQHPTPDVDESMLWLTDRAPDVRTAVLVLGRYPHEEREHRLALRRVDLRRTNFYSGTLINVDLADSNLAACWADGVRWERCRFSNTDLRKTSLANATLNKSNFRWAYLQQANLQGASLREADLSNAHLRGADLRDADLRDAQLDRTDLSGANLSGAHLLGALLTDIRTDQATTWPTGFTP
jgi:Pentapeptide repeats (8 copies)